MLNVPTIYEKLKLRDRIMILMAHIRNIHFLEIQMTPETFRYMHRRKLDADLDVLTMCSCRLPQSDSIRKEFVPLAMILFRHAATVG
ncbi:hypothetical protein DVH24_033403 [Malus domestica]|uniref:Uncharacterized protein n=1 Tax=Malus domestica TaxID=3750 RepID=A0A498JCH9_MALDO|nr:hypothetical protein DVH24_033403 [Malus domestica]